MKVKLTKSQIEQIAQNPDARIEISDPWYVIVLKVIAYVCGLLLAGMGTASAANLCGII